MAFDYSKYDFEELVQELTRLVSEQGEWVDTYESSAGQVLIQLVSIAVDNLHYMLERRSQENFLPTARLASSVGAISNLLGYRPDRAVSARGTLSLQLVDGNGDPVQNTETITIPRYTTITYDIYNFVTAQTYTFLSSQTYPVDIEVIEGVKKSFTFDPSDASGTLYNDGYVLIEDYQNIENSSFYIHTPTQVFTDVNEQVGDEPPLGALAFAGPTDNVYDVRVSNRGIQIVFGDDVNGAKPTGLLTVEYIDSSGPDVEIQNTGLEFAFETNTLQDEDVPPNSYFYTLSNTTTIDGGDDAETVAETKILAPDFIRTGNRAVTTKDYEYWAKKSNVGGIIDAKAYGEEELGVTVSEANNVYLTYLTNDGNPMTETEIASLRTFLDIYKTATTHLILQNAVVIPLQINIDIKRSAELTASQSEVYDYVKDAVNDFLALGDGSLGDAVYHSEIVELLHNLTMVKSGVARSVGDYVNVDIKALYDLTIPYSTKLDVPVTITYGSDGDTYVLTVDGVAYSYTAQAGDDADAVASTLASYIDYGLNVTASAASNVLTVSLDADGRENDFLYSEDLTNSYWTKTGVTSLAGAGVDPSGGSGANSLTEDTSNGHHKVSVTGLNAGQKIVQVRAKADTRDHIEMWFENTLNGERATTVFDLTNGLVVSGSGNITADANGFYICEIEDNTSSVADGFHCAIYNAGRNYVGDGSSGLYLWGMQLTYSTATTQYAETTSAAVDLSAPQTPFTISKDGTTQPSNVVMTGDFYLPTYLLDNPDSIEQFVRGSVELILDDGTVLYTDDGAGTFAGGTIDYVTGQVVIPLPETEQHYWIRYLQNTDENFFANPKQAFIYSLPKANYTDVTEELSTIVLEL